MAKFDANDPRLTAYLLGELDEAERAAVEEQIETCAETRRLVDDLRETADALSSALTTQPAEDLRSDQRAAIGAAAQAEQEHSVRRRSAALGPLMAAALILGLGVTLSNWQRPENDLGVPVVGDLNNGSTPDDDNPGVTDSDIDVFGPANRVRSSGRDYAETITANGSSTAMVTPADGVVNGNGVADVSGVVAGDAEGRRGGQIAASGLEKSDSQGVTDQLGAELFDAPASQPNSESGKRKSKLDVAAGTVTAGGGVQMRGAPLAANRPSESRRGSRRQNSLAQSTTASAGPVNAWQSRSRRAWRKDADRGEAIEKQINGGDRFGRAGSDFGLADLTAPDTTTNSEAYAEFIENPFIRPLKTDALSTFAIDVDTASYSNVRRFITHDQLPPPNAVRIEELVNYFRYDYAPPADGVPFSVHVEAGRCPWNIKHRLVQIGLQGREIPREERPPVNLVFLVDVSGSMRDENKLPLVRASLELLAGAMDEDDRIAIVTYAGKAGLRLPSTCGSEQDLILQHIRGLTAGGSTNGEAGIRLAYETAVQHFQEGGTNRVVLCTDGDFNVGISDDNELVKLITNQARSGVFLSVLGFGMGNLKDARLEQLADKGNGHYGYVDSFREARKVFVEELTGTLFTIASDVKIQVEFNPARVAEYRLIGYENRLMAAEDFRDDTKDAGEIGAGHRVTALYEVVPAGTQRESSEPTLKYQPAPKTDSPSDIGTAPVSGDLLTVSLRYKEPEGGESTELSVPLVDRPDERRAQSAGFDWAAAVTTFGLALRESQYRGQATFELAAELALGARLKGSPEHRREFIALVHRAAILQARRDGRPAPSLPQIPAEIARQQASVDGKYSQLLKTLPVPGDLNTYGPFVDFGEWSGDTYGGESGLPSGYWVFVYPNWYIWGHSKEATETAAGSR